MTPVETRILAAFADWLGREAIDTTRCEAYCNIFQGVLGWFPDAPTDAIEVAMEELKAVADGFARSQLGAPIPSPRRLQPLVNRSRLRASGLRRGTMGTPLAMIARRLGQAIPQPSSAASDDGPFSYFRMNSKPTPGPVIFKYEEAP